VLHRVVDWLTGAGQGGGGGDPGAAQAAASPPLDAVVPEDHPLRTLRSALDAGLAGIAADDLVRAVERLGEEPGPATLAALLLLELVYDARDPDEVVALLRYDLAARWFVGWPDGPFTWDPAALARAMLAADADPLLAVLRARVLTTPEVAARQGDWRWRVRPARLGEARRHGRWGERRLRRRQGGGRLRRLAWRSWLAPWVSCSAATLHSPCQVPPRTSASTGIPASTPWVLPGPPGRQPSTSWTSATGASRAAAR
jgi:hypothetical protein